MASRISVVKEFFSTNTEKPVQSSEFMEFWKNCNEEERAEFAAEAAKQLGLTVDGQ